MTLVNASVLVENDDIIVPLTTEEKNYLDSKPYFTVSSLEHFQPFNFKENNKAVGYSIDVINVMGKYLNKEIKYISQPWAVQLELLEHGKLDIIPNIAVSQERKKFVEYTDFSHITYMIGFATKQSYEITSINDLFGKKVSVVNKSYFHDYLEKNFPSIELVVVSSTQEAIEQVVNNNVFAVISNVPTLNYFIHQKWLANLTIHSIDDLGIPSESKLNMGVSKGNLILKSILEKTYQIIPQRELNDLQANWMNIKNSINNKIDLNFEEKSYLQKKQKILMCVLPNWLPFEQIDENGKHKGIGADFMKIISQNLNTPIELLPTKEWAESLQNLRDRKCDILPVAMDVPSRRNAMNFTTPYVSEPFVVATKSDQLFIKNAKELSNKKIGVVKSYAFIDVLKRQNPDIQIIDVANTKEGLERVRKGELYGYIDTMPAIAYWMQKYSIMDLKIAGKLEFNIKLSIATRNDEPLLSTIMQKAIDNISEEQRRTIVGQWISIKVAQEFDYTKLLQLSALFFIVLLLILYKNRTVSIINKELLLAKKAIEEQQGMVDKYVLILTTDLDGIITEVNEAYSKEIGYSKEELIGKTHSMVKHPQMKEVFYSKMWSAIENNQTWTGEIKNITKEGDIIWFLMNVEPIYIDSEKVGYRSISQNITDKKIIEKLSVTDQLTNLYNRHYLEKAFFSEMSRSERYNTPLSVIIIDIDYFKLVNDTYGHEIGDETLKSVAKIIDDNVRKIDIIGRWGGEEFIIIAPNTTLENAAIFAEKLRIAIENYDFKEVKHKTASFGVASLEIGDTREILINKADGALYIAKKQGRNRVELYTK